MRGEIVIYGADKIRKAATLSRTDGRLRYVYWRGEGLIVSLRRPDCDCYWTNGVEGGTWSGDHRSGIRDSCVEEAMGEPAIQREDLPKL
jgi:hypothetical protein